jgi:AcrR family transcriptional regulator
MKFTAPTQGRKGAYYQRNREALINATQRILAEKGSETKIEDIAKEAEMAVSTIYKHFPNREELIETAIVDAMLQWERDTLEVSVLGANQLDQLVLPMRAFLQVKKTHPLFAQLVANNRDLVSRMAPKTASNLEKHVMVLVKSGTLEIQNPELRIRNLVSCLFAALEDQLTNPKAKETENLRALAIALGMLGIEENEARRLLGC